MVGDRHGPSNTESFIPRPLLRVFHAPWRWSISEATCSQWSRKLDTHTHTHSVSTQIVVQLSELTSPNYLLISITLFIFLLDCGVHPVPLPNLSWVKLSGLIVVYFLGGGKERWIDSNLQVMCPCLRLLRSLNSSINCTLSTSLILHGLEIHFCPCLIWLNQAYLKSEYINVASPAVKSDNWQHRKAAICWPVQWS